MLSDRALKTPYCLFCEAALSVEADMICVREREEASLFSALFMRERIDQRLPLNLHRLCRRRSTADPVICEAHVRDVTGPSTVHMTTRAARIWCLTMCFSAVLALVTA